MITCHGKVVHGLPSCRSTQVEMIGIFLAYADLFAFSNVLHIYLFTNVVNSKLWGGGGDEGARNIKNKN